MGYRARHHSTYPSRWALTHSHTYGAASRMGYDMIIPMIRCISMWTNPHPKKNLSFPLPNNIQCFYQFLIFIADAVNIVEHFDNQVDQSEDLTLWESYLRDYQQLRENVDIFNDGNICLVATGLRYFTILVFMYIFISFRVYEPKNGHTNIFTFEYCKDWMGVIQWRVPLP